MTLEENIYRIWAKLDDEEMLLPIVKWPIEAAWDDINRVLKSRDLEASTLAISKTEELIKNNLEAALLSPSPYVRKYAELLSTESGEN